MTPLRFFLDTHDRDQGSFPATFGKTDMVGFYPAYEAACYAEGVIPVRLHVGFGSGRAFCLTMAPDADAVKRAHDRLGLPYDSITEVTLAAPGDALFAPPAAA
jgi:hypothetical protein